MVSFTVNAVCVLFEPLFHQQQNLTLFHEVRRVSLANISLWGWLWLVVHSVWKPGRAPTAGGKLLLFRHTEEHTWWWSLPFPSSNKTVRTNGACNWLQSIKEWFCHFLSVVNSFIMFHNGIGTLMTARPSFTLNDMAELLDECLTSFHPVCIMLACICLQRSLWISEEGIEALSQEELLMMLLFSLSPWSTFLFRYLSPCVAPHVHSSNQVNSKMWTLSLYFLFFRGFSRSYLRVLISTNKVGFNQA